MMENPPEMAPRECLNLFSAAVLLRMLQRVTPRVGQWLQLAIMQWACNNVRSAVLQLEKIH